MYGINVSNFKIKLKKKTENTKYQHRKNATSRDIEAKSVEK